ncbi:MAG: putative quinol monooxygenase [Alphaproteobacteria bacterium]|nr:putative quinol monooxygenase [Alphaproteobacteria bacterium]
MGVGAEKLILIASIVAEDENRDFILRALRALLSPTRNEAGCERYDLVVSDEDPNRFLMIETWASRGAWLAHMETEHIADFREKTRDRIASFELEHLKSIPAA